MGITFAFLYKYIFPLCLYSLFIYKAYSNMGVSRNSKSSFCSNINRCLFPSFCSPSLAWDPDKSASSCFTQMSLATLPVRLIPSRPDLGRANHNHLSNMGRGSAGQTSPSPFVQTNITDPCCVYLLALSSASIGIRRLKTRRWCAVEKTVGSSLRVLCSLNTTYNLG